MRWHKRHHQQVQAYQHQHAQLREQIRDMTSELEDHIGKVSSQEESLTNTQMDSGMKTHSEKRGVVQHLKGSLIVNLEL